MFETRLRIALAATALALALLVVRLVDLQIVRGAYFREESLRALLRKPEVLRASRGSILGANGEILVQDEPAWDVLVDFDVIAACGGSDPDAWTRLTRACKKSHRYARTADGQDLSDRLRNELQEMWRRIGEIRDASSPAPLIVSPEGGLISNGALATEVAGILERIREIRRIVSARRGFDSPVAEERAAHAVVSGLDRHRQIAAREQLAGYPWVTVEAATLRTFAEGAEPFAHVLGRVGRVDAQAVADDPDAEDPFRRYLPSEMRGVSGVEAAAERQLRGRRGQVTLDRDDQVSGETLLPETGGDVILTIQPELQRTLYRLLGDRVRAIPESSGGAIVVLDVISREVLALVSFPSYDPSYWDEQFHELRDDTERAPLGFRAVANRYAPGSIIKPLVCLTGLIQGKITPVSREECVGYLHPEHPDRWRCWEVRGTRTRMAHGSIDVVEALTGSCNVFLYKLGERLGVDALCSAFDMVGIGRRTGIGLNEENPGINPTPDWLQREKGTSVYPAHARLFAIGQGELTVTPLQAAMLAATYANGRYRQATLIRGRSGRPEWSLPGTAEAWSAIRRGMYGVVNDPEGTAYKYAHFVDDRWALCGKTGSATAQSWPTSFRIPYEDVRGEQQVVVVRAGAKGPACRRFETEFPGATYDPMNVTVASTWPRDAAPDSDYSHAWFAGFLQRIDGQRRPLWSETPRVAFAVLVEFGGSGGQTSGPLARDVARVLVDAGPF